MTLVKLHLLLSAQSRADPTPGAAVVRAVGHGREGWVLGGDGVAAGQSCKIGADMET